MLLVKTYLDRSMIHGIGLFALEPIPKGTVIWTFHPNVDRLLSRDQIDSLAPPSREQMLKYGYIDESHGFYVICGDDARHFNHSDHPNCTDSGSVTTAAHDIATGEELTSDYSTFTIMEPFT